MNSNFKFQISNSRGITLIEIIVVVFIIALFSMILISDFPKILRQYALSSATYKLSQDFKKTQDLGLSGIVLTDVNGLPIAVKGYGIYINISTPPATEYIIYADIDNGIPADSQKYSSGLSYPPCSIVNQGNPINDPLRSDCVVDRINVKNENPSLFIKGIEQTNGSPIFGTSISVNFTPPDPIINISDNIPTVYTNTRIGIVLGLSTDSSATRTVWVNTSGLINVQ